MPLWLWLFLLLVAVLCLFTLVFVASATLVLPITRGALFVPTSRRRVDAALEALALQPEQLLVDLGCGDGRVLRTAARRYGVRAVGYELNPLALTKAWLLNLTRRGVSVRRRNFWKIDLSDADAIFCYLFPDLMPDLAVKLQQDLRPGTPVVSCNFELPGWTAEHILHPPGALHNDPIYVYRR